MVTRSESSPRQRPRRTGRRPGDSGTRDAILRSARKLFAERGYAGATIRGIAQDAGVDAALIHHFFDSKEGVFTAALDQAIHPEAMMADIVEPGTGLDGAGERLVRVFLALWEDEDKREPLLAMLRSAVTQEEAARLLREFIAEQLYGRIAAALGLDARDRDLRATLIGSQLIGMALLRYVIRIEPLASVPTETVVTWLGPTVQNYLTADHDELLGAAEG
jgi:AcrR family transcriptional regulator